MTTTDHTAFEVTTTGHVAEVRILDAAMGPGFFRDLPLVFRELDADPDVRAIVLAGHGDHFSFGLDLKTMGPLLEPMLSSATATARRGFLAHVRELQASITSVAECRTPVVAAISGWCIGGGIDLAAGADVRLAAPEATFSIREARMAIVADLGSLQRLVGIIGDGHLRELALTGADFDATRAERIGLVNAIHEDVLTAAHELAAAMAANSPLVLGGVKDVLDQERSGRVEAGLRYVAAWNAAFIASNDLGEALTSFAERRPARFTGE